MGIFSNLNGGDISLTPQGALLLAAISITAIDGDIDEDEIAIIRRLDRNGTSSDWDSAVKAWKTKSVEDCVAIVSKAMNKEQQLTAMSNLLDIAMADGVLGRNEELLLEAYSEVFDIAESEIQNIIHVISIKNRSIF